MKSINRFLIEKGIRSNTEEITILQMVQWVDEWQEELKQDTGIPSDFGFTYLPADKMSSEEKEQFIKTWEEQCELVPVPVVEVYEYEIFIEVDSNTSSISDFWLPVVVDKIKDPERIEEYIKKGLLRRITVKIPLDELIN